MISRDKIIRTPIEMSWLVKSRGKNQKSALRLYKLITKYKEEFDENVGLKQLAAHLLGINFSLWRAVFLSDVDKSGDILMFDIEKFLKNLIENNLVAYQQDRNANHWTFRYYVLNARFALNDIRKSENMPNVVKKLASENLDGNAHDWWELHQNALDSSILRLKKHLKRKKGNLSINND